MIKGIVIVAITGMALGLAVFIARNRVQPPVAKCVSVSVDGYTNFGRARFAWAVITNRGPAAVRVWGWASFQGPLPAKWDVKHEPTEHTRLLAPGSSLRKLIAAPANGLPWRAEFQISRDSWYVGCMQRLRGPRLQWAEVVTGIGEPEVRVEVVHSASRSD